MKSLFDLVSLFFFLFLCTSCTQEAQNQEWKYDPAQYVAVRTTEPPDIDGKLSDAAWENVPWSADFLNIEGKFFPKPAYRTRIKITWDQNHLYVGAELEEPGIWATFTERESIIFHENNFEIFIDPDGDTHHYYEYEINALGTEWDLLMNKPYRDGGPSDSSWDIIGIKSAVDLKGTINNGRDTDEGWSVEVAIPWSNITELIPIEGTTWRMNFSRVEWDREVTETGEYRKKVGLNNKPLPEQNWVWSPPGEINMHMPERWGFVQFTEKTRDRPFIVDAADPIRWKLRQVYYRQKEYIENHGQAATSLTDLGLAELGSQGVVMETEGQIFNARLQNWQIEADSRIWYNEIK